MSTNAEPKLNFKPRMSGAKMLPDAPDGGWDMHIPTGSTKVTMTQDGDPMLTFTIKLVKAHEAANGNFNGAEVVVRNYVPDDMDASKVKGANAARGFRIGLAAACGVDYGKVWPGEIKSEHSFEPFIKALEGKSFKGWTVSRTYVDRNGEERISVDVRFSKPGGALGTTATVDDNPDRPSAKKR